MFRNVVSKLFKTWIAIVGVVSIVGFCWCSIVVFHDSYVAYKALSKAKDTFPKIDPNGNTWDQLQLIKDSRWLLTAQDVKDQFTAGCFNGAEHVFRSFKYKVPQDLATSCRSTFYKLSKDKDGFVDGTAANDNFIEYGCGFGIGAALKKLKKVDQLNYFLPKVNECVARSESELKEYYYEQKPKEFEAQTGISLSKYGAHINDLWGDSDFSNISYLLVVSLWLVVGGIIVVASYGLKKWMVWLVTK